MRLGASRSRRRTFWERRKEHPSGSGGRRNRELQKQADPERRVIHKTRWCVPVGDLVAEIDVFEGFTQYAYCEVELPSPQTPYELPTFLQVIREVTEDRRFTNAAISRDGFPPLEE